MKQASKFLIIFILGIVNARAQEDELQIGDKIPEVVWNTPLKIAGPSVRKDEISLNDYKGKLIVLDFWSTWCVSCIRNMPYLHSLENAYSDDFVVLPVTYEDAGKISRFLSSNVTLKPLNLFSIVEDSILRATFPSKTLPHLILIDREGALRAITDAPYITEDVLNGLIANTPNVYIPNKRKDIETALVDISSAYDDVEVYDPKYYSVVTGFLDGSGHNMQSDSAKNVVRYSVINAYLDKLYTCALPRSKGLPLKAKRSIYEVKSPSLMGFSLDNYWNIKNRRSVQFCYEIAYPATMSKEDMCKKMKQDLDFFFGMDGRIEEREIECFVLREIGDSQTYRANGGVSASVYGGKISNRDVDKIKSVGVLPNGVDTYIRNMKFAGIEWMIDRVCNEPVPTIVNETGYDGKFDVDFPSPGSSLKEINSKLKEQGLELITAKRKMDMFVLTEVGFDAKGEELVYTKYGYVYPSTLANGNDSPPTINH